MKYLKKALKISLFVFILLLASLGVGIAGGIPPSFGNKKQDHQTAIMIELFEEKTKVDEQAVILEVN